MECKTKKTRYIRKLIVLEMNERKVEKGENDTINN